MKLKNKKGFTLAECMVCLLLISILATILLPAIMQNRPNRNKVMFRKAYYITERIVSELINDEDLYPNDEENGLMGFANFAQVTHAGVTTDGTQKFCQLFFQKVNTTDNAPRCVASTETLAANPTATDSTFMTNDGMMWALPSSKRFASTAYAAVPEGTFDAEGNEIPPSPAGEVEQSIYVDVNGVMAPNCFYDATTCQEPDRFEVFVRFDGKIRIEGVKEREYLISNTTLK